MLEYPQAQGSVFLQKGLIHRTRKGIAVRSKSELLIAEALEDEGIAFEYEKSLCLNGKTRYPDFTIEDDITGRTVYWEHLGMLDNEIYRRAWNNKLSWYKENGVKLWKESEDGSSILIYTEDSAESGLDMSYIRNLIQEVVH